MFKKFLSNKKPGFFLLAISFVSALLMLIFYTVRGGNYLSPVSNVAIILVVIGLITNALAMVLDFGILGIVPVVLYSSALAVLLNTEMLFISNVAFGVDGNSFDTLFFLFWIFLVIAIITSAVGFSLGISKSNKLVSKE